MKLEASTLIAARPGEVFDFFAGMAGNYTHWHRDHVAFRWLGPEPHLAVGSQFHFEEGIGGKRMAKTMRFAAIVPDRLIVFEPTWWLLRFFLPWIRFEIEPTDPGVRVTQQLRLRIGPLAAWLNRRELDAVRAHMTEEGENMKRLIGGPVPGG